jgi:hypothetical protein
MASIQLKTARSEAIDPQAIAEDLMRQLGGFQPRLVTLYATRERDQRALNRALRDRLPKDTRLIGATTAGEIDRDGLHMGSVVIGALGGDFSVGIGMGGGLSKDAISAGSQAVTRACEELGVRPADLSPRKHVGLVIDDGFRNKKEELLLGLLDRNQGLVLVGGGASDGERDPAKQSAELHVDGEVVTDAVLLAIFHTDAPWAALRHHWYEPTGQLITITKVDDSHRRALEIDGKPAALRYAELIGVPPQELPFGMPRGFSYRPTATKVGREYFMRAAGWPLEDGSIVFANLLEENSEYELMRATDPVASTRKFLQEEMARRVDKPTAALLFHCGGRMWVANAGGFVPELSEAFKTAPPSVGFNVQFEIYCGFHINTTLTALVFGGGA